MLNFLTGFIDFFFGCWHRDTSRAFTVAGETYIVCLDCGRRLPYSLEKMSVVDRPLPADADEGVSLEPAPEYATARSHAA